MRMLIILLILMSLPWLAACNAGNEAQPEGAEPASPTSESPADASGVITDTVAPTVVQRSGPPPTPTIDPAEEPFAPVTVEGLPGLRIPAAAVLVDFESATSDEDARADFTMAGADVDELTAWFDEQLSLADWTLAEERDGALVFLHVDELSARFAEEGLKRTVSIFFDTLDDVEDDAVSFTIVAEAPKE